MQLSPFLKVFSLSPFPLCALLEGTHDDRVAGDNTRHAHREVSFPRYATRSPTKRTTLVGSLVLFVKLGVRCGRRLAPPTPNKHIPLISTPWISVRLSAIQTQFGYHRACAISSRSDITATGDIIYYSATATKLQYHLRKAQISLLPAAIMTPISLFCLTALFVLFIMV